MRITRRLMLGGASSALALGAVAARAAVPVRPRIAVAAAGAAPPGPLLDRLAAFAAAELGGWGFPGMTLAVQGADGLSATIALGYADLGAALPVDPAHLFQIGSISKSMVALCLFRLADQRRLNLDARVSGICPDLPLPPAVTVAQLLNHSSGLPGDAPLFPRVNGDRLWTEPPGRFAYSNTGFDLLGHVVARASGMPYPAALKDLVLGPLGLSATEPVIRSRDRARFAEAYVAYRPDLPFFPHTPISPYPWLDTDIPAGSVASTPADMARYIRFLSDLGRGNGAPLISDALARRFVTTTIDAGEFGPKGRYANGIATADVDGRTCLQHTGGMIGFSSSITVDPGVGGAFASVNIGGTGYRPRAVTRYACALLFAARQGLPLPPPPPVKLLEPVSDAVSYAGRYLAAGGGVIVVRAAAGALFVEADGATARMSGRGYTDHPRLFAHDLVFEGEGTKTRLWWGGTLYGRDAPPPAPPANPALDRLAGLYLSNDPWVGGVSVVARGGKLIVEGSGELLQFTDGSWRFADPDLVNERVWFDAVVNGKAQRVSLSGADMMRFHDVES